MRPGVTTPCTPPPSTLLLGSGPHRVARATVARTSLWHLQDIDNETGPGTKAAPCEEKGRVVPKRLKLGESRKKKRFRHSHLTHSHPISQKVGRGY